MPFQSISPDIIHRLIPAWRAPKKVITIPSSYKYLPTLDSPDNNVMNMPGVSNLPDPGIIKLYLNFYGS